MEKVKKGKKYDKKNTNQKVKQWKRSVVNKFI